MATITTGVGHIATERLPWAQWGDTIWVKVLRCDEPKGVYTLLTRFAAGTQLPKHRHFGAVYAYTIGGRWRYLEYEWVATSGDFVYEQPGTEHTLVADEDTEVVFTIEGGLVLTGENGELFMYEDLATARERYYLALAMQGKEQPVDLLGGTAATVPPGTPPVEFREPPKIAS
jgi:quercetin dioxygenase-like cupin family protein